MGVFFFGFCYGSLSQLITWRFLMRRLTYWLTVTLIFIIPWEDSISVVALGSLARVMGLVVAAFWGVTMLIEGRFRKPHFFHVLVLFFFLWNFVSMFWSTDTVSTMQRIKTYSQIFLLMLIFWEMFQKPNELMGGLQAYVLGTYVLILSTIFNYINGNVAVAYEGRYSATGVNAVDLALILMLGLPVAMQLFFLAGSGVKGIVLKLLNLAYIPLAVYSIILTGSRTSLIAVMPFVIYLIGTRQIKFDRKIFIFGVLVFSMLALLPFIPQSVTDRLSTLGASIESSDIGGRVELWLQAILVFSRHPFVGLGSGTMDSSIGSAAHNTFISVAAETGFVGFMLFLAILAVVFFQATKIQGGNSGLWVAIFLTWVIGVCSLSWEFRKLTWIFLNFIIIEGNFTYEKLLPGEIKERFPKNMARFVNIKKTGINTGAG
ncbi:MAG: O-antigen ligase family protein [Anaerolineales bacterium]|nr:O-antigen ligase family protein [Anaerolineales bacterium]